MNLLIICFYITIFDSYKMSSLICQVYYLKIFFRDEIQKNIKKLTLICENQENCSAADDRQWFVFVILELHTKSAILATIADCIGIVTPTGGHHGVEHMVLDFGSWLGLAWLATLRRRMANVELAIIPFNTKFPPGGVHHTLFSSSSKWDEKTDGSEARQRVRMRTKWFLFRSNRKWMKSASSV